MSLSDEDGTQHGEHVGLDERDQQFESVHEYEDYHADCTERRAYSDTYLARDKDYARQRQDNGMACHDVGKQTDHQCKRLRQNAEELNALFDERFEKGDVNILEVNKVKMELMNLRATVAENDAAYRTALQNLLAMNGNMPLEFDETVYPLVPELRSLEQVRDEVMGADYALKQAQAGSEAARKLVKVNRHGWLPKLEVGYGREGGSDAMLNGFVVGVSVPIFSNRGKVKAARARQAGAELAQEQVAQQVEADIQSLFNEATRLRASMQAYDTGLMDKTLSALKQAVEAGFCDKLMFEDAETTVENGAKIVVNSVSLDLNRYPNMTISLLNRLTARTPGGFSNTITQNTPKRSEESMDGIKDIKTVDGLKAAFPDLTKQIEDAAVDAERKRIQDIEDVALAGFETIVNDAKFKNPISAGDVAKAIVAEQKKQGGKYIQDRDDDAVKSGAGKVGAGGQREGMGGDDGADDVDAAIDKLFPETK